MIRVRTTRKAPTTEAGKALLANIRSGIATVFAMEIGDESDDAIPYAIATVEAEARAPLLAERDRLLRVYMAVQGVREFITLHRTATGRKEASISKVLALLEDALDGGAAE